MIEMTTEMVQALWRVLPSEVQEGREPDDVEPWVEAVLAAVERDLRRSEHGLCSATVETKGALVRCLKKADGHDAHLGRHDGWDVVW